MAKNKQPTYKKLKSYDIRKGLYPIRLGLTIWDDGKSKPFIDFYSGVPTKNGYKHNSFKITNQKVWHKIKTLIDFDLINDIRKNKPAVCPKCKSPYWDRPKTKFNKDEKK